MFYVIYKTGLNQPRVLGGFSVIKSATDFAESHSQKAGHVQPPEFKQESGTEWIAELPDTTYWIREGNV